MQPASLTTAHGLLAEALDCKVHHRLIHHSGWIVRIRDGLPEFIPPAWVDPERTPRRRALLHLAA